MNAFASSHEGKVGVMPGEWKPTTCQGCTTWCPAEVFVQDGRATKVRGNRYSKQNDGNSIAITFAWRRTVGGRWSTSWEAYLSTAVLTRRRSHRSEMPCTLRYTGTIRAVWIASVPPTNS